MTSEGDLRNALEAASFLELRALAHDSGLLDTWADYAAREDSGRVLLALAKRDNRLARLTSAAAERGML